jgi:hypothetical protein
VRLRGSSQLSSGFNRDAERVKETAETGAAAIGRLVDGLREAAERAR